MNKKRNRSKGKLLSSLSMLPTTSSLLRTASWNKALSDRKHTFNLGSVAQIQPLILHITNLWVRIRAVSHRQTRSHAIQYRASVYSTDPLADTPMSWWRTRQVQPEELPQSSAAWRVTTVKCSLKSYHSQVQPEDLLWSGTAWSFNPVKQSQKS
jgi:hypothetical protein